MGSVCRRKHGGASR